MQTRMSTGRNSARRCRAPLLRGYTATSRTETRILLLCMVAKRDCRDCELWSGRGILRVCLAGITLFAKVYLLSSVSRIMSMNHETHCILNAIPDCLFSSCTQISAWFCAILRGDAWWIERRFKRFKRESGYPSTRRWKNKEAYFEASFSTSQDQKVKYYQDEVNWKY